MTEQEKFTNVFANVTSEQQRKTVAGMAHWAGTGPAGRTCRECLMWTGDTNERYAGSGELKPAPCRQYAQKMPGKPPKVPHHARACKYFEERPAPLKAFAKKVWG